MSDPACCCGHVRDEHYRSGHCTIEDCECVCFEADPDWSDQEDDEALYVKTWGLP